MRTETSPAPLSGFFADDECRIVLLFLFLLKAEKPSQFLRNVSVGHLVHLVRLQHGQPCQLLQAPGAAAGILTHGEDFRIRSHIFQNVLSYGDSNIFHEKLYDVAVGKGHPIHPP